MRVVARAEAVAAAQALAPPPPRFIFHSAYCCSTMLARAFDLPGAAMGYKEPQILNDAVGLRLREGDPRQVAAALDAALWLLARPPARGEVAVIKPSNVVNPLIPAILALRPESRALLLHAPLEAFLGSVARKEIEGRAWVRELMWKLIRLGLARALRLQRGRIVPPQRPAGRGARLAGPARLVRRPCRGASGAQCGRSTARC